jgi:8-oxo-dGTP diphosphatase
MNHGLERLISAISPLDELEATHRADALEWMRSGAEIYRRQKPDVPPKHLVAYFALVDVDAESVLLVDHINANLWLPAGGHVEPDEDPRVTVTRELAEELGVTADLVTGLASNPLFVTETTTVGADSGHVDVSLWYVVAASVRDTFEPDVREFRAIRWWTFEQLLAARPETLDPQLPRFVTKLRRDLARHNG